jgi:site-specific DNA recombinase
MSRQVTVIPAIKRKEVNIISPTIAKKRVAAYARVSTGSEEQLTSYEAQVDYYTKYITSKPEWKFVGIYTDEGITAVNTKYSLKINLTISACSSLITRCPFSSLSYPSNLFVFI